MGNLLESLPGIVFFLYVIAKILHGLNKDIEGEPNIETDKKRKREIKKGKQHKSEPQIEAEIEGEFSDKSIKKEEKRKAEFKTGRRDTLPVKLSAQERSSKKKEVLDGEMTRDDILRGVIFKEILDQPRALRKYRPPYHSE
ncbi:hypothetical protein [Natroniella sp. ANB-PHB2]|uniref:hypothetical protein n=1 Tax=Natroniella sp. ANB-PHB2 TaxID=3384444 RepID=UPI0038D41603